MLFFYSHLVLGCYLSLSHLWKLDSLVKSQLKSDIQTKYRVFMGTLETSLEDYWHCKISWCGWGRVLRHVLISTPDFTPCSLFLLWMSAQLVGSPLMGSFQYLIPLSSATFIQASSSRVFCPTKLWKFSVFFLLSIKDSTSQSFPASQALCSRWYPHPNHWNW